MSVDALICKHPHTCSPPDSINSAMRRKNSRAPSTPTPGNPSANSLNASSATKWSNSACTGTRVPAKTGVPLITSGSREMINSCTVALVLRRDIYLPLRCEYIIFHLGVDADRKDATRDHVQRGSPGTEPPGRSSGGETQ